MIADKIKSLFQFIEYLHSNIDNFNQYNDLICELELLIAERNKLRPGANFKDKLKYDEVQTKIDKLFKLLQDNTSDLIKAKARELNICGPNNTETVWNWNSPEIHQLKENFSKEDLPEIFKHKSQYIEYRNNTHKTFFSLQIFFADLDKVTKKLFDFFNETEHNEFEGFETKAIPVNDIREVAKLLQQGHTKFTLPNSILNPSNVRQQPNLEPLPPQQTETKAEQEIPKTFEGLFYNPEHAEPCLKILSELHPPVIDAINNYIGKAKGVFPLWVKVLKNHKPQPLIKHFKDAVYKDVLNQKIKGLNLSKDASEFRKQYKRVENDKIELDIKTILSQYTQNGKLGK